MPVAYTVELYDNRLQQKSAANASMACAVARLRSQLNYDPKQPTELIKECDEHARMCANWEQKTALTNLSRIVQDYNGTPNRIDNSLSASVHIGKASTRTSSAAASVQLSSISGISERSELIRAFLSCFRSASAQRALSDRTKDGFIRSAARPMQRANGACAQACLPPLPVWRLHGCTLPPASLHRLCRAPTPTPGRSTRFGAKCPAALIRPEQSTANHRRVCFDDNGLNLRAAVRAWVTH